jgi:hypothetical protein
VPITLKKNAKIKPDIREVEVGVSQSKTSPDKRMKLHLKTNSKWLK